MKKTMIAIAAAVMMSVTMTAQDNTQPQQGPRPMDKAEMTKARTEQMVKDYGLSEEQAQQLLALNTEFFDKMPMMGRGHRGGRRGGGPQAGEGRPERPQQADSTQRGPRGDRPHFDREEMRKAMEAYNDGVKKIFTEEQFKKYQDDMARLRGPRGGQRGGQRGPRR